MLNPHGRAMMHSCNHEVFLEKLLNSISIFSSTKQTGKKFQLLQILYIEDFNERGKKNLWNETKNLQKTHFMVGTRRISKAFAFLEQSLGDLTKMLFEKWDLEGRDFICGTTGSSLLPEMDFCLNTCLNSVYSGHYFVGKWKGLLNQKGWGDIEKTCLNEQRRDHKIFSAAFRKICSSIPYSTICKNPQKRKLWETVMVGQLRSSFFCMIEKLIKNFNFRAGFQRRVSRLREENSLVSSPYLKVAGSKVTFLYHSILNGLLYFSPISCFVFL